MRPTNTCDRGRIASDRIAAWSAADPSTPPAKPGDHILDGSGLHTVLVVTGPHPGQGHSGGWCLLTENREMSDAEHDPRQTIVWARLVAPGRVSTPDHDYLTWTPGGDPLPSGRNLGTAFGSPYHGTPNTPLAIGDRVWNACDRDAHAAAGVICAIDHGWVRVDGWPLPVRDSACSTDGPVGSIMDHLWVDRPDLAARRDAVVARNQDLLAEDLKRLDAIRHTAASQPGTWEQIDGWAANACSIAERVPDMEIDTRGIPLAVRDGIAIAVRPHQRTLTFTCGQASVQQRLGVPMDDDRWAGLRATLARTDTQDERKRLQDRWSTMVDTGDRAKAVREQFGKRPRDLPAALAAIAAARQRDHEEHLGQIRSDAARCEALIAALAPLSHDTLRDLTIDWRIRPLLEPLAQIWEIEAFADGTWGAYRSGPTAGMYGAVSETGYRSVITESDDDAPRSAHRALSGAHDELVKAQAAKRTRSRRAPASSAYRDWYATVDAAVRQATGIPTTATPDLPEGLALFQARLRVAAFHTDRALTVAEQGAALLAATTVAIPAVQARAWLDAWSACETLTNHYDLTCWGGIIAQHILTRSRREWAIKIEGTSWHIAGTIGDGQTHGYRCGPAPAWTLVTDQLCRRLPASYGISSEQVQRCGSLDATVAAVARVWAGSASQEDLLALGLTDEASEPVAVSDPDDMDTDDAQPDPVETTHAQPAQQRRQRRASRPERAASPPTALQQLSIWDGGAAGGQQLTIWG